LGVPEAARDDLVHDVFLVVARRLDEYDGRAAMTTWLFGIARGVARNLRRSAARHQRKLQAVPNSTSVRPSHAEDPAELAERKQAVALVERFLEQLDPAHRAVFEFMEVEGMTAPEVARTLRVNANTVYTRLRTVRARFHRFVQRTHKGAIDA
jgi:RNA polymerase sigma-70 factor, ECF subfamily